MAPKTYPDISLDNLTEIDDDIEGTLDIEADDDTPIDGCDCDFCRGYDDDDIDPWDE